MILALADDFSGAAEIAGIGHHFGLRSELFTDVCSSSKADLVVVDTNTRSLSEEEAVAVLRSAAVKIKELSYDQIFKKMDSVLRGHVTAEIGVLVRSLGYKKVILAPANPSAGRTIRHGSYFVDGIPLDQTAFAEDPEFPATSSEILQLLGRKDNPDIYLTETPGYIHPSGVTIGPVSSRADLHLWAEKLDETILPCGGSEFFELILDSKGLQPGERDRFDLEFSDGVCLAVLGSAGRFTSENIRIFTSIGFKICKWPYTPVQFFETQAAEQWTLEILKILQNHQRIVLTPGLPKLDDPQAVATRFAEVVRGVCTGQRVRTLMIEGGATAAAIFKAMNLKSFSVYAYFARGVTGLRHSDGSDTRFIVKPGSYPWPVAQMV